MFDKLKQQPLAGWALAVVLISSTCCGQATPSPTTPAQKAPQHKGVLVAGHGTDAFESIFVEVFDMLGEQRVQVANYGLQKVDQQRLIGFTPLPELLDMLPQIGADSLLYVKVTPGMTDRAATVYFQCFDTTGHIIWQEKANDVLVDGGNTIFHPNGWKKKLAAHIGKPGLATKSSVTPGQP